MLKEVVGIISMMIGVVIPGDAVPECRCTPAHPCWAEVPWRVLNTSVKGRLQLSADELAPCLASSGGDPASAACALTLNSTDNGTLRPWFCTFFVCGHWQELTRPNSIAALSSRRVEI